MNPYFVELVIIIIAVGIIIVLIEAWYGPDDHGDWRNR